MLPPSTSFPLTAAAADLKADVFAAIGYSPHPAQQAFHDCHKRFRVLTAGSRFGKSLAAAHDVLPFLLRANTRGWIVGPSYRLADMEFRYLLAAIKKLGIEDECKIKHGGYTGPSSIVTAWGAEAHTLTAKTPANLLGEELDWLICSESARLKDTIWEEYLHMRLASRAGIAIFPSMPNGFNEYFRLFSHGQNPDIDEWAAFQHASYANPHLPKHVIEHARKTMPDYAFRQQVEGQFIDVHGKIFTEFKQAIHVTDDLITKHGVRDWELVGGMDFGHTNPTHVLAIRVSRSGRIAVTMEYHSRRESTDDIAENMRLMGLTNRFVFCDPANPGMITDLALRGFTTTGASGLVSYGLRLIDDQLRMRSDGLPGLLIDSRCTELIKQFETYSWAETRSPGGEPRPKKEHDHGIDALRYALIGLGTRPQIRIVGAHAGYGTLAMHNDGASDGGCGSADPHGVPPRSSAASSSPVPPPESDEDFNRRDRAFWAHVTRYEAYVREVKDCEMWGRPKPSYRVSPPGPIPTRAPP
jgi:hypothetical protein